MRKNMNKIAVEFNILFDGIGKTISNLIGLPVKQFEAHLKGIYPVIVYMNPTKKTINITYRT